ncbi:hypothetical protein E2C01_042691 [Portunus trituberculatus]|uniref:Uncharacterized protein n=1 Tax=Portunus trituberculatus TaxID=210409 RepID=A0A5B7FU89_PORTR|nr:hypothetical protein [Portunus trituberculatus]
MMFRSAEREGYVRSCDSDFELQKAITHGGDRFGTASIAQDSLQDSVNISSTTLEIPARATASTLSVFPLCPQLRPHFSSNPRPDISLGAILHQPLFTTT